MESGNSHSRPDFRRPLYAYGPRRSPGYGRRGPVPPSPPRPGCMPTPCPDCTPSPPCPKCAPSPLCPGTPPPPCKGMQAESDSCTDIDITVAEQETQACSDCTHRHISRPQMSYKEPVGMTYVPWQTFGIVYEPGLALQAGTIFPELNYPFEIGRCAPCKSRI